MNKASSLIVLIVLGSLVADAVAQTNPRGAGYNPPGGGASGSSSSSGGQSQAGSQGGQSQGGTSGRAQGGSSGGQSQAGSQGGSSGGQSQSGSQGGNSGSQTGGTYQPYPTQQGGSQGGQGQQGPGQQQGGSQGGHGQQGPGQQQGGSQGGHGQQGPGQQQPQQPQYPQQGGQYPQQPQYPQYPSQPQYPQYPSQGQGQGGYSQSQTISQRPLLSVRSYERVELANLLRLPMSQSMDMQADSLTILAQGLRSASATLDVQVRGLSVAGPQLLRRSLSEIRVLLPIGTRLDDVEIISNDDVLIDSVSAQVSSNRYSQMGRPSSGQLLSLNISQSVRSSAIISLDQLVQQQLGLDLDGVTIERVAVQAQTSRGISGSVQLQLNNRLATEAKAISQVSRNIPLLLNSLEQVRSLDLIVRGDVVVTNIIIRVGQVRGGR